MKWSLFRIVTSLWLVSFVLALNRQAINAFKRPEEIKAQLQKRNAERATAHAEKTIFPRQSPSRFANNNTQRFAVDGTAIPDVNFDIGESYAGLLPVSDDPNETKQLYFWFFPSSNPNATDEITIWFNGGPGCSSLAGLLTENGPFLWQAGTLAPTPNTYSWTNLTNMMWVEQPVGVGYTQGEPTITNEVDLAQQFMGFYKQFVDTFGAQGNKVYLTGESYAGYYVPYIADAFISANDTNYYNLAGIAVNDPIIGDGTIQQEVVLVPFVEYWSNLFFLNSSFMDQIRQTADACNYTSYLEQYFTFPPPSGPFPIPDGPSAANNYSCDLFYDIAVAAIDVNPCFNFYHITDTCPFLYSQLGVVNEGDYSPPGAQVYFNRTDVQQAINAPVGTDWSICSQGSVFADTDGDESLGPAQNDVLRRVIEHTNNALIGVGNLDFLLAPNGTLFAIQNMTWGGQQGFQTYPQQQEFIVPYHEETNPGRLSEAGIVGYWGEERGLTFFTVQLSGHELPEYAAGSGYRMLEKLLGRISSLSDTGPFTTQTGNNAARQVNINRRVINSRVRRQIGAMPRPGL